MSSTNRGSIRNPKDFYPTPDFSFKPLLPHLDRRGIFWEPAKGDGRLVRWMIEFGLEADGDDIETGCDYLDDNTPRHTVITNPPFSFAFEFCKNAISTAQNIYFLLPLNFLGSQKRKDWFENHEPQSIFILSKRPSFRPDGRTDSNEYGWFYWGNRHIGIWHL